MKRHFGWLELLLVLVVLSLFVVCTIPFYLNHVLRSNRADAIYTLLVIQLSEKKYHANHSKYGTLEEVWSGVTKTEKGHYTILISNVTSTTYTITATGTGRQAYDSEGSVSCTTLSLTYTHGISKKTPGACWF